MPIAEIAVSHPGWTAVILWVIVAILTILFLGGANNINTPPKPNNKEPR